MIDKIMKNSNGLSVLSVLILAGFVAMVAVGMMSTSENTNSVKSKIYTDVDASKLNDEISFLINVEKNCTASLKGTVISIYNVLDDYGEGKPIPVEFFRGDINSEPIKKDNSPAIRFSPQNNEADSSSNYSSYGTNSISEQKKTPKYQKFGLLKILQANLWATRNPLEVASNPDPIILPVHIIVDASKRIGSTVNDQATNPNLEKDIIIKIYDDVRDVVIKQIGSQNKFEIVRCVGDGSSSSSSSSSFSFGSGDSSEEEPEFWICGGHEVIDWCGNRCIGFPGGFAIPNACCSSEVDYLQVNAPCK